MTESVDLKFDANITNLFNQATVIARTTRFNRNGNLALDAPTFFGGFNAEALVNPVTGAAPAFNPIYNFPSAYQGIREIRLGVHLQF